MNVIEVGVMGRRPDGSAVWYVEARSARFKDGSAKRGRGGRRLRILRSEIFAKYDARSYADAKALGYAALERAGLGRFADVFCVEHDGEPCPCGTAGKIAIGAVR